MDYSNLLDYILHLRQKSDSHKLIIFVGAGVSKNVPGMLDWQELIQKMADAINYSRCYNCRRQTKNCEKNCNFKNAYSTDEYLKIPQYVFNANKDKYFSILSENIPSINCDAPLSSAIFDLNPVHIITTNYDKLLESSSNPLRNTFDVIINDRQLLNSTKTHYIIKMHGDIEHPETIVLKEDDYLAYSREHVLIEMFVKALLADHSILFLGYSMNDYNVKLIAKAAVFLHFAADALIETVRHPAIIIGKQALHYAMNRSLQIAIRTEIASVRFFRNINILARHRLMALGTEQLSAMAVRAVKNLLAQCTDLEMITAAAAANLPARRFLHIFAQVEHLVA